MTPVSGTGFLMASSQYVQMDRAVGDAHFCLINPEASAFPCLYEQLVM